MVSRTLPIVKVDPKTVPVLGEFCGRPGFGVPSPAPGSPDGEEASTSATFLFTGAGAATGVVLTPSLASPQVPGASVLFTAAASGGSGSYEYTFRLWSAATNLWTTVQPYGAANSWTWNSAGYALGTYSIAVWARSVGSALPYDTYKAVNYVLQ